MMKKCMVTLCPMLIAAVLIIFYNAGERDESNSYVLRKHKDSTLSDSHTNIIEVFEDSNNENSECCTIIACAPSNAVKSRSVAAETSSRTSAVPSRRLCSLQSQDVTPGKNGPPNISATNLRAGGIAQGEDCSDLPQWSRLPRTQFTDHVLEIVTNLNISGVANCDVQYHIHNEILPATSAAALSSPISRVQCDPNGQPQDSLWCETLRRVFHYQPPLPHNVSVGFMLGDSFSPKPNDGTTSCLGSSSSGGKFSVPNMQEILEMNHVSAAMGYDAAATIDADDFSFYSQMHNNHDHYRWPCQADIPWEKRDTLPIFRGRLWASFVFDRCADLTYDEMLRVFPARLRAVDFSVDHPDLLNARFSGFGDLQLCFDRNATNGLSKVLPLDPMPSKEYFSNHQVAVVLEGIGAAFRLTRHFMTGTAVVLQAVKTKEWFTPYLEAYVHYIPLSKNLGDMEEKMRWIQEHPKEVKQIAENGRAFYEKYLTFAMNEKHIYELVYRLSEYTHYSEITAAGNQNEKMIAV